MKKEKRARARRTGAQAAKRRGPPGGGAGKTLRYTGFAQKLTAGHALVLAMALLAGGRGGTGRKLRRCLNEAGQQAEVQHLLQCYARESDLLDGRARGRDRDGQPSGALRQLAGGLCGRKAGGLYRGDAAAEAGRPPPRRRRNGSTGGFRCRAAARGAAQCIPRFPGTRPYGPDGYFTACTRTAAGRICCSRRRWRPWAIRPSRC